MGQAPSKGLSDHLVCVFAQRRGTETGDERKGTKDKREQIGWLQSMRKGKRCRRADVAAAIDTIMTQCKCM